MHAIPLAARERANLALLPRALEIEPRHVRARRHFLPAELDLVVPARDLFPDGLGGRERFAALIDVADLHGLPEPQRAGIRLLLPGHHPEQRRLAGAVRSDDADDAAARQREIEVVDEEVVAVALLQIACLDDDIAETRARRNVDFRGLNLLRGLLAEQIFVRIESRLALGLPRARRHANPFELALERPLTPRLGLLFLRETTAFLLQPGRIVSFPRDSAAAIELENPARHVVEEVAVVRDRDDGPGVILEKALEPRH